MALSVNLARQISTTTKTHPQYRSGTPRWLLRLLPYVQLSAGAYRVNRVIHDPLVKSGHQEGESIDGAFAGYDSQPQEYTLSAVETTLKIHSRVMDVYNDPYDQLQEQMMVTLQVMKEKQEFEIINNKEYGLLNAVVPEMVVTPEVGPPTPNDMDNLISNVWEMPAFFLAHPKVIARFGQECTSRGVCIGAVEMFGSPFQTWRGIPIVPSDKLTIDSNGKSNILLMRVGEEQQGVVGLHQAGIRNEVMPSVSARFQGIDDSGMASYLLTIYHSVAILTEDALGVIRGVQV